MPYVAYKKQWFLAGCFFLNAVAIVCGTILGATDLPSMLTWSSLVILAFAIYQLLRQTRASRSVT
jgi:hypothetical protein